MTLDEVLKKMRVIQSTFYSQDNYFNSDYWESIQELIEQIEKKDDC
jgi:hypothetical protein